MFHKQFSPGPSQCQEAFNALAARDCPDRTKIPVRARLVWENDGEECKDGEALGLGVKGPAIFFELVAGRCKFTRVWLHPAAVVW